MKIKEVDARRAGICRRMRPWFRKNGLDWDAFCGAGVDLSVLLAVGDQKAMIMRAKAQAERRLNE